MSCGVFGLTRGIARKLLFSMHRAGVNIQMHSDVGVPIAFSYHSISLHTTTIGLVSDRAHAA